jgi:hypothetical protein
MGQLAMLALLNPGGWGFGYRSIGELDPGRAGWLCIVALQGVAVLWGLHRQLSSLIRAVGAFRLAGFLLLWTFAVTSLSRSPIDYLFQLALTVFVHLANLGALALLAQALPLVRWPRLAGMTDEDQSIPPAARWTYPIPYVAGVMVLFVAGTFSWLVFKRIPHVPDSVAYLFQAKTYASGRLYLSSPPVPELFEHFLIMDDGQKWFSVFPPGWPLVLALGILLGVPWLVNPVLGGVGIVVAHALVRCLHTRGMANGVTLLLAFSPAYLIVSASFMSHTLSIVCAMLCLLGIARARATGKLWWAGLAGLGMGTLFLTRPIEGVVLAVIGGCWASGVGGQRLRGPCLAAAATVAIFTSSLFFVNNYQLTGSPFRDPIQKYFDVRYYPGSNVIGFGKDKGNVSWSNNLFAGHSPLEAAIHVNLNLNLLDIDMLGWGFGSLMFVGLFMTWRWGHPATRLWMAIPCAMLIPATLYWYAGADLGPRYWYQLVVPLIVLTVHGAQAACRHLDLDPYRMTIFFAIATVVGTATLLPWRGVTRYRDYRGMRADLRQLASTYHFDGGLVLIRSRPGAESFPDYGGALIWNTVPIESGTIYAREGSASAVVRLREEYKDRPVWIVAAPSVTGGAYEVVAGPLKYNRSHEGLSAQERPN